MSYLMTPKLEPGDKVVLMYDNWVIVGIVGTNNDYAVYCGLCPASNEDVAQYGDKIARDLAEALLPMFKDAGLRWRP